MPLAVLALSWLQSPPLEGCRKCEHRGVLDCPKHSAAERASEAEVTHCSVAARCADCGGALLVDCPKCDGGPDSHLIEERRALVAAWLAQEDPVEAFLKRPLARVETPHFRLILDATGLRDGKKTVDSHAFLHTMARDLERVAVLQDAHFGAQVSDRRSPERIWLWGRSEDHAAVMGKFLASTSAGDFKMLGRDPVFSAWCGDQQFHNEAPVLLGLVVHNGAHLLLSNLFREQWIGDLFAGWMDEGAGHWYEDKVLGQSTHFCVDETGTPEGGAPRITRASIRQRLEARKDPVLPVLLRRLSGELTADEHAYAFAFYDWLVDMRPQALTPLLRGYQEKHTSSELLPEALGMNLFQAEETWRAWVSGRYPAVEPKPKR